MGSVPSIAGKGEHHLPQSFLRRPSNAPALQGETHLQEPRRVAIRINSRAREPPSGASPYARRERSQVSNMTRQHDPAACAVYPTPLMIHRVVAPNRVAWKTRT